MKLMNGKMDRLLIGVFLAAVFITITQPSRNASADNTQSNARAKNIILLIADGAGFNHFLAADYYQHGAAGMQVYGEFPFQMAVSTYEYEYKDYIITYPSPPSWSPWYMESGKYEIKGYDTIQAWSDFNYAIWRDLRLHPNAGWWVNNNTDSASAATAMATGFKTKDGAIGYAFELDAKGNLVVDDQGKPFYIPVKNIVEYAEEMGKATGVVSSVPFSHATPAAFVAHNPSRGDTVGIAQEMLYRSKVDVIMGPASPDYNHDGTFHSATPAPTRLNEFLGGSTVFTDIQDGHLDNPNHVDANGDGFVNDRDRFRVIRDRADFQAMAFGPTPDRVFGLPKVRQTLQYYRHGSSATPPERDPYVDPFITTVPTLAEMARAALNVLDNDPDGFFLMIEGGAVDWAAHASRKGRMIEEMIDFNSAVEAVVEWVEKNSNWGETMVIVTSDHETGYLWGPGSNPSFQPLVNNGQGVVPSMQYYSPIGWHTNMLVPLFAKGAAARLFNGYARNIDLVYGPYVDNTDIFKVMKASMENYYLHQQRKNKSR